MTAPLQIVLLLHFHRPPGAPVEDQEQAWSRCFEPIIGALHHMPEVRCGLVLAGDLIEDLQAAHPEGIAWMRELVDRGQIELVATALHEPVLSSIPERDGTGQLQRHATLVKRVFGARPRGAWLPHHVWDPSVPRVLSRASLDWTVVPDQYLVDVGAPGSVYGVYRTEREGMCVGLLPVDSQSVSMMADVPVRDLFLRLRRRHHRGEDLITLAVNASTFGLRPGRDPKADQSWLATLLAGLARARPGVRTVLPSRGVDEGPYRGRIYLPSAAPDRVGVPWERNLARYDEANRIHKKMLRVSRMVNKLRVLIQQTPHSEVRPDPELLHQAHRYLYRGQSADVYWHGPHAGIYDPAARERAWRDLLRAEHVALQGLGTWERIHVETLDLDCDGTEEVIMRTPAANVVVDPARGGGVSELSLYEPALNLANTMTRVWEDYHRTETELADLDEAEPTDTDAGNPWEDEEPTKTALPGFSTTLDFLVRDLERGLSRDRGPRVCFVERLLAPDATLESLQRGNFTETGRGYQDTVWELVSAERHGDEALSCILTTGARVADAGGERRATFTKRYVLTRGGDLEYRFELANRSHEALRTRLAVELNLTLGPDAGEQAVRIRGKGRHGFDLARDQGEVEQIKLMGSDLAVEIVLGKAARLWHYPVQTVHRHFDDRLVAVQGVCLLFQWPVELWGKEKERVTLTLRGVK